MQIWSLQNQHFDPNHHCASGKSVSVKLKRKNVKDNKNNFLILKKWINSLFVFYFLLYFITNSEFFMSYILHTVFYNTVTVSAMVFKDHFAFGSQGDKEFCWSVFAVCYCTFW